MCVWIRRNPCQQKNATVAENIPCHLSRIPKTIRLKVNKCRALSAPAPKRPCGIRAYKTDDLVSY